MTTNNAVNLNSSGIISYDGAGTFSSVGTLLEVANGGTAHSGTAASITANAVICGGTSSTSQLQSVSTSTSSSGYILTSNGSSSLPSFQPGGTAYNIISNIQPFSTFNPTDSTTYYLGGGLNSTAATDASTRFYMPTFGRIVAVYGAAFVQGTLGSSENATVSLVLNGLTTTTVTSTLAFSATSNTFSNSSLNINVNTLDYINIKLQTPAWTTNPTTVFLSVSILLT